MFDTKLPLITSNCAVTVFCFVLGCVFASVLFSGKVSQCVVDFHDPLEQKQLHKLQNSTREVTTKGNRIEKNCSCMQLSENFYCITRQLETSSDEFILELFADLCETRLHEILFLI